MHSGRDARNTAALLPLSLPPRRRHRPVIASSPASPVGYGCTRYGDVATFARPAGSPAAL